MLRTIWSFHILTFARINTGNKTPPVQMTKSSNFQERPMTDK